MSLKNSYRTAVAFVRMTLFWIWVIPIAICALFVRPRSRAGVGLLRWLMWGGAKLTGLRVRVHGKITDKRPLLIVANHISILEFVTFPLVFGNSFFGKSDIAKMPFVGWMAKKVGVIFVNRNPRAATDEIAKIESVMQSVKYPMVIYPEGTTSNGLFVFPFKSAMFNFIGPNSNLTIQPVVMHYRDRHGNVIPDAELADDYSYPDNKKIRAYNDAHPDDVQRLVRDDTIGPFGFIFNIMKKGGATVEITVLPVQNMSGMDRKQMADHLHSVISDKFFELKDKTMKKNED